MPTYTAPIRDMKFVMQEMLNVGKLTEYERFAEADTDTLDAILEQSGRFSSEVLAPLNVVGDKRAVRAMMMARLRRQLALKKPINRLLKAA